MADVKRQPSLNLEEVDVCVKSFVEPRQKPQECMHIFIQLYSGEFLCQQEVDKASRKRTHSFSHRTYAHDLYQDAHPCISSGCALDKEPLQGKLAAVDTCKHQIAKYTSSPAVLSPAVLTELELVPKKPGSDFVEDCELYHSRGARNGRKARKCKTMDAACLQHNGKVTAAERQCPPQEVQHYVKQEDEKPKDVKQSAIALDRGCTIVLRNIPRSVSQDELFRCLVEHGFQDDLVLLYMPWLMGHSEQANLGYAFVHLESWAAKQSLVEAWQGQFPFGQASSNRPINIALAAVQGARENITSWNCSKKMARIRNPAFRPMILKQL